MVNWARCYWKSCSCIYVEFTYKTGREQRTSHTSAAIFFQMENDNAGLSKKILSKISINQKSSPAGSLSMETIEELWESSEDKEKNLYY